MRSASTQANPVRADIREVMDDPRRTADGDATPSPADIVAEQQACDEDAHQALNLARSRGKAPTTVEETIRGAHVRMLDRRIARRRSSRPHHHPTSSPTTADWRTLRPARTTDSTAAGTYDEAPQ